MTPDEFKSIRKKAGLTQPALAKMLGKSAAMIAKYEAKPPTYHPIPFLVKRFMKELERENRGIKQ